MHRTSRSRNRDAAFDERAMETANLGILSVLLVLVPALVLMAHVMDYAAVFVRTPLYGGDGPDDGVIRCGRDIELEVAIAYDGFFIRSSVGQGWERVGASAAGYDHAALLAKVHEHKRQYPHQTTATITAEADVPYGTVVATLDTLRGPSCRLAGAMAGEEIPEDCLLWQPIIADRTPNHEVPEFRRSTSWPPRAPGRLDPGGHDPR